MSPSQNLSIAAPKEVRYMDRKPWKPGAFITDAGTIISDPRTGMFRLAAEATTAALHKLMRRALP